MEMRRFALPVVLGLFLALAPAASATNMFVVPVNGSIGGACDAAHPCKLETALMLAHPFDDITVAPGTYEFGHELLIGGSGDESIDHRTYGVTLHGDPSQPRPFIKVVESTANAAFDTAFHTTLRHLELTGIVHDCCSMIILRDTTVEDSILHGPVANTFVAGATNGSAIRNSVLRMEAPNVSGVISNEGNTELRNVTITGNNSNVGDGVVAACLDTTDGNVGGHAGVINSIIQPGSGRYALWSDGRNCFHDFKPSISSFASSFDPLWVRIDAGGTYTDEGSNVGPALLGPEGVHELANSPTIDAGKVDALSNIDIDGQARVQGEAVDIGADEFAPPPPPAPVTTSPGTPTTPTQTVPSYTSPIAPVILPESIIPPGLTSLRATGTRSTSRIPPHVLFTISSAQRIPFTVSALLSGRIRHGRCIAPAGKKGKRCKSVRRLLEGTITAVRGRNDVSLLADDSSQLSPGLYRVTLRAGSFGTKSTEFRVKSGRSKSKRR